MANRTSQVTTHLPAPPLARTLAQDLLPVGLALLALLAWDYSALDLPVTRWFGTPSGFGWRHHWLTTTVMHEGVRACAFAVLALLVAGVWWPLGAARQLPRSTRVWWLVATLTCLLVIPLIKRASLSSCPWALAEFGGVARHVSHWAWGQRDGGGGGCFPSGHASAAFSFLAGYFALRAAAPGAARAWWCVLLAVGLLAGWSQLMRGAHYVSHTLWTGWLCWCLTALLWHAYLAWQHRRAAPATS
jgi:membrane-associated PAP2 superfamily phosphatase